VNNVLDWPTVCGRAHTEERSRVIDQVEIGARGSGVKSVNWLIHRGEILLSMYTN